MQDSGNRPFVFTATGPAYFRIWIVNLLLTIVTIGIYSPWAKVRRIRYFYGNTLFDDSPFEFHGRPLALFYGRLIGLVLLVGYTQSAKFSMTLWLGVVAIGVVLFPWLLWRSLRFRLGNTSYRGIRFGFDGTVAEAYSIFVPVILAVIAPTLVLLIAQHSMTLGDPTKQSLQSLQSLKWYFIVLAIVVILSPWFYFRLKAFPHRRARLGTTPFAFDGSAGGVYAIAGKTVLYSMLFSFIGAVVGAMVGGFVWLTARTEFPVQAPFAAGILGGAIFYLLVLSAASVSKALTQNYFWNRSRLGGVPFTSTVGVWRLWGIELGNLVLTLLTLGIFWPFAVVRSMRYRVDSLAWAGDSDALVAAAGDARIGATGEETADLFGFDLAF